MPKVTLLVKDAANKSHGLLEIPFYRDDNWMRKRKNKRRKKERKKSKMEVDPQICRPPWFAFVGSNRVG